VVFLEELGQAKRVPTGIAHLSVTQYHKFLAVSRPTLGAADVFVVNFSKGMHVGAAATTAYTEFIGSDSSGA
jgi:hypothetical protein